MSEWTNYDDEDDGDDSEDQGLMDCQMMPDGTCMLAGSEECDFECPIGSIPLETSDGE